MQFIPVVFQHHYSSLQSHDTSEITLIWCQCKHSWLLSMLKTVLLDIFCGNC